MARSRSRRRFHKKVLKEERRKEREGYAYPNVFDVKVTRTEGRTLEELRRFVAEDHRQE